MFNFCSSLRVRLGLLKASTIDANFDLYRQQKKINYYLLNGVTPIFFERKDLNE